MAGKICAGLVLLAFGGTVWGQSLGDAAAREKQRRESLEKAKKEGARVYTDQDLEKYAGGPPLDAAGEPKAEATAGPHAGAKAAREKPGEESPTEASDNAKRRLAEQLKPQMQQCEAGLASAKRALAEAQAHWEFVDRYPFNGFSLDEAGSRLEGAKSQLKTTQEACEGIEDRARREGIPPGWIR